MDQKDSKTTCMACSCPCVIHKEHNHGAGHKDGDGHDHDKKGGGVCLACQGDKNAAHTCGA